MKKMILIAAILVSSIAIANTGDDNKFVIGEKVTLKSNILDEERSILVYLPQSYNTSNIAYPVMYVLDGNAHFHHASGIVQFLSSRGLMPETIVIAITNVDRTRDFTPTQNPNFKNSGGAKRFIYFLADELIPFVNRNYRTANYKTLVGHSFGGTFTTYAFLNRPNVFQSYIAISPYLHYENDVLVKEAKSKLKSKYERETVFYMTLGYEPRYFAALDEFTNTVKTEAPKRLEFDYVQMMEETHMSIPHRSIYNGLEFIYSDWEITKEELNEGLPALDKHYRLLSKKYGNTIETPEAIINKLGYDYINAGKFDEAIKVLKENVKRFPKSANVYDSLGEAFEKNKQLAEAKENYEIAVNIAEKESHTNLSVYKMNLERVK